MKCPACEKKIPDDSKFCNECGYSFSSGGSTGQLDADTILENRYVIVKTLGHGGMGAVYLALDRRLGNCTVAIKEMSTRTLTGDLKTAIAAFKKEASILESMQHPALPGILNFFTNGEERWYLVMDYIEGQTLAEVARRRGPIPEAEVLHWARQLCEILDYLHNQHPPIIFRDLKPANIMLTPHGQIKLIDFGIARHFRQGNSSDTSAYGSTGFAAPEQYGESQTDPRSDIYSLGATLHCLLTGKDPAKTPFLFNPPSQIVKISPGLEAVIMKTLALKAADRPASIKEMMALLPQAAARTTVREQTISSDKNDITVANGTAASALTTELSARTNGLSKAVQGETYNKTPGTVSLVMDDAINENYLSSVTTEPLQMLYDDIRPAEPDQSNNQLPIGKPSAGKKKTTGIIAAVVAVLLLFSGGFAWYQSQRESSDTKEPGTVVSSQSPNASPNSGEETETTQTVSEDEPGNEPDQNDNEVVGNGTDEVGFVNVTSGVTVKKYVENGVIRGIRLYLEPSLLPAYIQTNARYTKCNMADSELDLTQQKLKEYVDKGYGSRTELIQPGLIVQMTDNVRSFDQVYGMVVFLDANYQVIGCFEGMAQ